TALEPDRVDAREPRRTARGLHVRRDVLGDARSSADHGVAADPRELVDHAPTANDRPVLHRDVAGELNDVGEDDVIAEVAVVRDVRVGHEQTVPAHARRGARLRREVECGVLANLRAIADLEVRALARVLEILRWRAEYGAVMQVTSAA